MALHYLPQHHMSLGTDQELLFSDTEPMAAAEKAPNSPYEFLELNDRIGPDPSSAAAAERTKCRNFTNVLLVTWYDHPEGRNHFAIEYSNDLH